MNIQTNPNFSSPALVTITKKRFDELLKKEEWLSYLEEAGVDNWEGISYAYELKNNDKNKE